MILQNDFTKEQLRPFIIELAKNDGFIEPSISLDRLLKQVKAFELANESKEMTRNFYLTIHNLCKENQDLFWSDGHRKDITKWLKKANGTFIDLFDTTWLPNEPLNQSEPEPPKEENETLKKSKIQIHFENEINSNDKNLKWE